VSLTPYGRSAWARRRRRGASLRRAVLNDVLARERVAPRAPRGRPERRVARVQQLRSRRRVAPALARHALGPVPPQRLPAPRPHAVKRARAGAARTIYETRNPISADQGGRLARGGAPRTLRSASAYARRRASRSACPGSAARLSSRRRTVGPAQAPARGTRRVRLVRGEGRGVST
jgi:hypothetical protein